MTMSFDVAKHRHVPIEIYGEAGSLIVPDPNHFGGKVELGAGKDEWHEIPVRRPYADANYRINWRRQLGSGDARGQVVSRKRRPGVPCPRSHGNVSDVIGHWSCSGHLDHPERPAPLPDSPSAGELG